jgi:hypothetical protein
MVARGCTGRVGGCGDHISHGHVSSVVAVGVCACRCGARAGACEARVGGCVWRVLS